MLSNSGSFDICVLQHYDSSLQRRTNLHEFDNEALAFRPVLGSMLGKIYHCPHNKEANQSRLENLLQFWASKEVFDQDTISSLDKEMRSGPPPNTFSRSPIIAANSLQHPGTPILPSEKLKNITQPMQVQFSYGFEQTLQVFFFIFIHLQECCNSNKAGMFLAQ